MTFSFATYAVWAMTVAVTVVGYTFAIGFDNASSPWAIQPFGAIVIYWSAALLFALSLVAALRRRRSHGQDALRPGRYLFPLDIVEVAPIAEDGTQVLSVRPLGDARDARIERERELVILFADGSATRWPLRTTSDGEVAMRRLEQAQTLLEELSYSRGLENAFTYDLFFDVRADASWSSVAPGGTPSRRQPTKGSTLANLIGRRFAPLTVGVFVFAVGTGIFALRQTVGARAVHERALLVAALRDAEERRLQEEKNASSPVPEPARLDTAGHVMSPEGCIANLRAKGAPAHRDVTTSIESAIQRSIKTIPVVFAGKVTGASSEPYPIADELAARSRRLVSVLERMFSMECPASVIAFSLEPSAPAGALALTITYEAKWLAKEPGFHPLEVIFDVSFGPASFRLTMPPPDYPTMTTRARSLFTVPSAGTEAERRVAAMTARAFDRLYDELFGLVFAGDPRVPIKGDEP